MIPYAALYERISMEDDSDADSASIAHQKEVLETYAVHHGYPRFRHFTDDGYTGRNFRRPGFQEMLEEIQKGHVSAVIVRDLSRLGRNYMETGHYMEEVFPQCHVRFIALMNDIDMTQKTDAVMAPFYNLMNDWYSRDLSRRMSISRDIQQKMGIRNQKKPVYGFRADPQDPQQWLVDPVAAVTIRKIHRMAMEGASTPAIARQLTEDRILRPALYARSIGEKCTDNARPDTSDYAWETSKISAILNCPEYKGTKTLHKVLSRNGRQQNVPPSQFYLFPDDHEAIIPPFLWDGIHDRRVRHVHGKPGYPFLTLPDIPFIFSCSRCGKTVYSHRWKDYYQLLCPSAECRPSRLLTDTVSMEPVVRAVQKILWNSIADPDGLMAALAREKHNAARRTERSHITRREDLEARRRTILQQQIRLDRDREHGLLDDVLIRALHQSYELELKKLKEEEAQLPSDEEIIVPPVSREDVLDALLRALFIFVGDISLDFPRTETNSQRICVRFRVRIPRPDYLRLQVHKRFLNLRWEIPEDAPTVEEALLMLAATELIL